MENENICEGCEKAIESGCSVYSPEGQAYRNRMGYCPAVSMGRYASWREDKPKDVKKKARVGQKKGTWVK